MRVKTLRGLFSAIFDERQESLLKAVLVAETAGLGEFFGAAVAGTVTAEHQIFGRVGEVDYRQTLSEHLVLQVHF